MSKNRIFEARWRCAVAIAQRINDLIDQGCIVLDEKQNPVKRFTVSDSEIAIVDGNSSLIYFDRNPEYDNGMHTPVAEYRAQFKSWVAIHPKDFQSIF